MRRRRWPGAGAARVTSTNARHREAPNVRAASSSRGSRLPHRPPTVRTTTATLKNAWAIRMSQMEPRRSTPSAPPGPSRARNATPTTTVGSTNGTISRAHSTRLPGNSNRPNRAAMGNATTSVTTVEAVASHNVNQATCR